jgi:hypothetical protein
MKKIIAIFIIVFTISTCAVSCYEQGETFESRVTLKMGSKEFKIKQVYLDDNGHYIYVVYPKDSALVLPMQSTMRNDDVEHTTVILD